MSLVTRCPACNTTFQVVRDQLRISDGWVRCGRCSHVFDATLDLHEAPDAVPAAGTAPPPADIAKPSEPSEPPELPEKPSDESRPSAEDSDLSDDEPGPGEAPAASATAPGPASLPVHGIVADELWSDFEANEPEWRPPPSSLPPFPDIDLNLAAPPSPPPPPPPPLPALRLKARELTASASDENEKHEAVQDRDQVQMQKALRRARIKSAKIASAKARDERTAAKASASSMVREASEPDATAVAVPAPHSDAEEDSERVPLFDNEKPSPEGAAFWQRRPVRLGLRGVAVLAVLLLVVQVLRHERDGIVARQPNLRPALASLCQLSGCELAALRQIGDIVIEGAAFAREKSGNNDYRLSFTLRNGAAVPLAMPAIELSLLDTQERAVVRRVLTASDYGAPSVLAARADQAASLPLTLSATEAATLPPIAGYRVEAFYP